MISKTCLRPKAGVAASTRSCFAAVMAALILAGCASLDSTDSVVEIRRTSFGIPHITAKDYRGLGYGAGHAFAQDNFCALAEKINQVNGERSRYFGATTLATTAGNPIGSITSLTSDFLYKLQYDKATIKALWSKADPQTQELADGYAAGYNRYLSETGAANLPVECRGAAWVRPIAADDLYLWWASFTTVAGSQAFAQSIVDGGHQLPAVVGTGRASTTDAVLADAPPMDTRMMLASAGQAMAREASLGDSGSNGWAFGGKVTENGKGMLLTNPHWPWRALTKFYLLHLTIPGQIDVMGIAYPGSPVPLTGFNKDLGWTGTVSTGPRFVIREMTLGTSPATYVVDGVTKAMTARTLTVEVKGGAPVTRTYYSTEFGPLLKSAALGLDWTSRKAFAFTDINLPNNRMMEQYLAMGRARTAEEGRQVMGAVLGSPLLNTLIADAAGDAVYMDYTTKPNLSDAQLMACALPGAGQTNTAAGRPTMDGSKSNCSPENDPSTRQPGLLPMGKLPFLRRDDYVANANNSYWLTNPAQPIAGMPQINGPAAADIGMRARMNLTTIMDRLAGV
ncbi:MAG: penicillin acylase family protein, partial [Ideonella sp.]|nr:penicillin acylase family protein [Ideonella sp.]